MYGWFADVIFQREKPLHQLSYALKSLVSTFVQSRKVRGVQSKKHASILLE